jgi:hypothetical protein
MKVTHYSVKEYRPWTAPGRMTARLKHETLCGTVCDRTKGTTAIERVTCVNCTRKLKQRTA